MPRSIALLLPLSIGVALAAACSSSSSSPNNGGTSNDGGGTPESAVTGGTGVTCSGATCQSGEVCCTSRTSPQCTAAGSCQGSFLSCTSTATCGMGQVCCFSFTDDSGSAFATQCQASCPSSSFKLCASDTECNTSAGETCTSGQYTTYCGMPFMPPMFDAGGGPPDDAGTSTPPDDSQAPVDAPGDTGSTAEAGTPDQ